MSRGQAGTSGPVAVRLRPQKGGDPLSYFMVREVRAMPITVTFKVFGITVTIRLFQTEGQKKDRKKQNRHSGK